jgi:hypothetical protein
VQCVGCDVAANETERYHKVDARLDWSIRLDSFSPFLTGYRVRPSTRVFRAWGVGDSLADLRNDEGFWAQAALARHWQRGILHEVYFGWRGGQLPIRLQEEKAWFIGLTLVL